MRRDLVGDTDGDPLRSVDEQQWDPRRQHARLHHRVVKVRQHVDRLASQVGEQRIRREGPQSALGIPHGRRRVVVDRPKVAVPVDERHVHGKFLSHPDQRVVNRRISVRMELTQHLSDDSSALPVGLAREHADLAHSVEDSAVHRLAPVANVRQRTPDDHAHRITQVRARRLFPELHLHDPAVARLRVVLRRSLCRLCRRPARQRPGVGTRERDPPHSPTEREHLDRRLTAWWVVARGGSTDVGVQLHHRLFVQWLHGPCCVQFAALPFARRLRDSQSSDTRVCVRVLALWRVCCCTLEFKKYFSAVRIRTDQFP